MLGYSYQITEKHAARSGRKCTTYANLVAGERARWKWSPYRLQSTD